MKKCGHKGCKNKIEEQYRFCFEHRKDKYQDVCYIHGKTMFSEGKCLKCQDMKKPIYRIHKRGNEYYFNRNRKPISKSSFIYPYCKQLTHKTISYQNKYIGKITTSPGIYGIFVRDKRRKDQMGECLYVGQSRVGISTRVRQHKKSLALASRQIQGIRSYYGKSISWNKLKSYLNIKMELKYYSIIYKYSMSDLKFISLHTFSKKELSKFTNSEINMLLTCFEQMLIDVYKPSENRVAARPSSSI